MNEDLAKNIIEDFTEAHLDTTSKAQEVIEGEKGSTRCMRRCQRKARSAGTK